MTGPAARGRERRRPFRRAQNSGQAADDARDPDIAIRSYPGHYGLAAYVWTHDIGNGLRTAHAIESGWVQFNQGLGQVPGHSYGGYKQSGIGREFSLEGKRRQWAGLSAPCRARRHPDR
jgi:hypothetical protein